MPEGGGAPPAAARDDLQLVLQRAARHDPAAAPSADAAAVLRVARGRERLRAEGEPGDAEVAGGRLRQIPAARVAEELPAPQARQALPDARELAAHIQLVKLRDISGKSRPIASGLIVVSMMVRVRRSTMVASGLMMLQGLKSSIEKSSRQ